MGLKLRDLTYELFTTNSRLLTTPKERKKLREKGENAGNQHFLLFPLFFLPFSKQFLKFHSCIFYHVHMLSTGTSLKFCHFVKTQLRGWQLSMIRENAGY